MRVKLVTLRVSCYMPFSDNADEEPAIELTVEEKLLAALLGANAELLEALKQYDDLERVGLERKVEDRSRKEVRIDRRVSRFCCRGCVQINVPPPAP